MYVLVDSVIMNVQLISLSKYVSVGFDVICRYEKKRFCAHLRRSMVGPFEVGFSLSNK